MKKKNNFLMIIGLKKIIKIIIFNYCKYDYYLSLKFSIALQAATCSASFLLFPTP